MVVVIRDDNPIENQASKKVEETKGISFLPIIAAPFDRAAAFVIDYLIVLMPVLYLVAAPFQRMLREASLAEDQWKIAMAIFLGFVATWSVVLFYQSVMVWLWQRTVGKMFLGLRVENIWPGEKINFSQSFSRAFFWSFSWLFLGLPFLEIFSNIARRPFHDRVSDTVVVSKHQGRTAARPGFHENTIVLSLYAGLVLAFLLLAVPMLFSSISGQSQDTSLISRLESEEVLCPIVSEAQGEWPLEKSVEAERLSVAMGLYASGAMDLSCLEAEVENLFAAEDQSPLLYLARSFVYANNRELSDLYLRKVCDLNAGGDECALSRVIDAVSTAKWPEVHAHLDKITEASALYATIWAARQFLSREEYEKVLEYLNYLPDLKSLADFTLISRTKSLWALNRRDEAEGMALAAYSTLGDNARFDLAGFMCFEKIWADCSQVLSKSCEQFTQMIGLEDGGISDIQSSITYLRKWECEGDPQNKNYEDLMGLPLHRDVKALALALNSEDTDGFSDLLDKDSTSERFSQEVSRRMVERTKDKNLLSVIEKEWQLSRPTLAWRKLGESLFRRYYQLKDYELSLKVAERLLPEPALAPQLLLQDAIVAAVRSGKRERADLLLNRYSQIYPLPMSAGAMRWPASSMEFTEAVKLLKKDGL